MNGLPDHIEIEVKFYLADTRRIIKRLTELGARIQPEVFETNIRFEDSSHSLKENGKLLRLRQDRSCRLTYKCPPDLDDLECKVFRELEVEVSDFDTMTGILRALGYRPVQIYEKRRQTFAWHDVELCLDAMPFGTFLEIEGPKESIKDVVRQLDLDWQDRILTNYLAIFEVLRNEFKLPFNDVTFAAFEKHPVNIGELVPRLRAGNSTIWTPNIETTR